MGIDWFEDAAEMGSGEKESLGRLGTRRMIIGIPCS